jgi:hypothetical protein
MSDGRREAHMRRYLEEVFNGHDLSRLDHYLDADIASHWLGDRTLLACPPGATRWPASSRPSPTRPIRSRTSSSQATRACGAGPGAARRTGLGKASVTIIGRFEGDRLVEDWVEYDRYNMLRQLGAV